MVNQTTRAELVKIQDLTGFKEVFIGSSYKIYLNKRLGSGSFGEIYLGVNLKTKQEVAIKLENVESKTPQLAYEAKILKFLQDGEGFPQIYFSGTVGTYNVMIIQTLGSTLEQLFSKCGKKFSLKTVLMLADSMLTRIEFIHSRHFLHRDIKPENFLMGLGKNKELVYLIDFGLSKRFRDPKTGEHINYTDGKSLTGTALFASLYTHLGIEQSRRDDLESLAYMLIYFLKGELPWQGIVNCTREERLKIIMEKKIENSLEMLCRDLPEEILTFFNSIRELQFETKPDYKYYRDLFRGCMKRNELEFDYVFDWSNLDKEKFDFRTEINGFLKNEVDLNKPVNPKFDNNLFANLNFKFQKKEDIVNEKNQDG